jgi:hypothetical protein
MRALLALALMSAPAAAEPPLTAAEFEAYTEGLTLTYRIGGRAYGIEQYLSDRRVRWVFIGGECLDGTWYPAGDQICFAYDGISEDQCWSFYRADGGLQAIFENNPESTVIFETRASRDPLICPGPRIGV